MDLNGMMELLASLSLVIRLKVLLECERIIVNPFNFASVNYTSTILRAFLTKFLVLDKCYLLIRTDYELIIRTDGNVNNKLEKYFFTNSAQGITCLDWDK